MKSKAQQAKERRTKLSKAQEVMYRKEFKRANTALDHTKKS